MNQTRCNIQNRKLTNFLTKQPVTVDMFPVLVAMSLLLLLLLLVPLLLENKLIKDFTLEVRLVTDLRAPSLKPFLALSNGLPPSNEFSVKEP
jgi:hypothetical protein